MILKSIKPIYLSHNFDYLIWFIFLGIGLTGVLNHELWMDEAQHWLVVRDVTSFSEFIKVEAIDGQPFMWPILLFFIHAINSSTLTFQLFHFCIGAASSLLFLRKAPFEKHIRYLFILSYPMLYEYLVISRNYSLSILFLLIYLIYFRNKSNVSRAIVLGILANTHFFAAILASALLIYDLNPKINDVFSFNKKKVVAYLVFVGFIILLFLQLKNSLNHAVLEQYNNWTFFERCKRMVLLHFKSFIVIPDFSTIGFWGSSWPLSLSKTLGLLAIPSFIFPWFFFNDNKVKLAYYLSIVIISGFLFTIHQPIAYRYSCFIFIVFIAFYWLQQVDVVAKLDSKIINGVVTISLLIQMLSGITAVYFDTQLSFSQGKNVAKYINENDYSEWAIIIHPYSSAPSISLYLGKPYYSLLTNSEASFCRWETNPFMISNEEFYQRLSQYVSVNQQNILLVKNTFNKNDNQIDNTISQNGYYEDRFMRIEPIKIFEPAVVANENYMLYEVDYKKSDN
ncbi:hypothetical protein [Ekhidna sp.]